MNDTTTAAPATVADLLDEAANVIARNGWTTGAFLDPKPGKRMRDCKVCAYGAIRIAAGTDPDEPYHRPSMAAAGVFAAYLIDTHGGIPMDSPWIESDLIEEIGGWNDDDNTADAVEAELRACAAKHHTSERQGGA